MPAEFAQQLLWACRDWACKHPHLKRLPILTDPLFANYGQVAVAKYQFRQKCTAASFASVLKAWNEWQPWKLDKQRALVDVQCGFNQLRAQVGQLPVAVDRCPSWD